MDDEILTLPQALKILPIGDDKLRRMAKAKEIPCRKVGGRYLFIKADLIAWIRDGYTQEARPCRTDDQTSRAGGSPSREYDKLLARRALKNRTKG